MKLETLTVGIIVVIGVFSVYNLVPAYSTYSTMISVHKEIAKFLSEKAEVNSALLTNLRQYYDIQYYTNNKISSYQLPAPHIGPIRGILVSDFAQFVDLPLVKISESSKISYKYNEKEKMFVPTAPSEVVEGLISQNNNTIINTIDKDKLYFLSSNSFGLAGFPILSDDGLVKIATFNHTNKFLIIDPTQEILTYPWWRNPGPSDLLFYYQYSQDGVYRQMKTQFDLYKFNPQAKIYDGIFQQPRMIESYDQQNILQYGDKYYSIPQGEGSFDIRRIFNNNYTRIVIDDSVEDIKHDIDNRYTPILIHDNDRGYDVYEIDDLYLAIPTHKLDKDMLPVFNFKSYYGFDDQVGVWRNEQGVSITYEKHIETGETYVETMYDNSMGGIYLNLPPHDLSKFRYVTFLVNGNDSDCLVNFQIRSNSYGGSDFVSYYWLDNFSDWKVISFDLNKPAISSGNMNWNNVLQVLIQPQCVQSGTMNFEKITFSEDNSYGIIFSDSSLDGIDEDLDYITIKK